MLKLEAKIHPKYARNYWFEDTRTGEEISKITLVPGEYVSLMLQQHVRGEVFNLATIILDFNTRLAEKGAEYRFYLPGGNREDPQETQPVGFIQEGQKKLFIPGGDGDTFMAPLILSLAEKATVPQS